MAKKTVVKKVAKKTIVKKSTVGITGLTEVPSLETRINLIEQRIDRLVNAIDKSKSVRGL